VFYNKTLISLYKRNGWFIVFKYFFIYEFDIQICSPFLLSDEVGLWFSLPLRNSFFQKSTNIDRYTAKINPIKKGL